MNAGERSALLKTILDKQQSDGGWSLTDLGAWKRQDDTALETKSDGYATGLTVLALEQSGLARHRQNTDSVAGTESDGRW